MRRVELLDITMSNFRSFREPTTFSLSQFGGFKLISGKNVAQPRLGPNGVGKSSIWDALIFCLFNSSVKGIRPSDLASWNGSGACSVRTRWLIDGDETVIERHSNPNVLTIDGLAVEEKNVEKLLGLSRRRFLQAVMFGQNMPLFVDLAVPDRAALLDEILDLGIWLRLSDEAKKDHASLSGEIGKARESLANLNGRMQVLNDTDHLDTLIAKWDDVRAGRIDAAIRKVSEAEQELDALNERSRSITLKLNDLPDTDRLRRDMEAMVAHKVGLQERYKALFAENEAAGRKGRFFHDTDSCPTCMQSIPRSVRSGRELEMNQVAFRTKNAMQECGAAENAVDDELQKLRGAYDAAERKRSFLAEQRAAVRADIANQERMVDAAVIAVETIADETNPYLAQRDALDAEKERVSVGIKAANGVIRRLQGSMLHAEYWQQGFRRVRLFLVKRVLAQLELETGVAAIALGLVGWRIGFSTELETKSGTIRPGIFVQVTSPEASAPWEAWSGGEAQRIRLAVAIGLSNMIQRMAGISISFEVWDEPSTWLSPEGIEDLLECLRHRAETTGKSLWLCDHRALIYSGFDEVWQVTKSLKGSTIDLISSSEG